MGMPVEMEVVMVTGMVNKYSVLVRNCFSYQCVYDRNTLLMYRPCIFKEDLHCKHNDRIHQIVTTVVGDSMMQNPFTYIWRKLHYRVPNYDCSDNLMISIIVLIIYAFFENTRTIHVIAQLVCTSHE